MGLIPNINFDSTKTIVPRKSIVTFILAEGIRQLETATVVGTVSTAGNLTVTVTAAGMTGSPISLTVAVLLADSDIVVAQKIRAAMQANANIIALFAVGGAGPEVTLTKLAPAANDDTLNIAIALATAAGITAAAASVDTIAGIAANTKVYLIGKSLDYATKFTSTQRKVPSGGDGLLRPDRIVVIEQEQTITFEIEDLKSLLVSLFGDLGGGFVQGIAQMIVLDPDDGASTASVRSNYFRCTAESDGGMTFKTGDVAVAKIKFTTLERAILKANGPV